MELEREGIYESAEEVAPEKHKKRTCAQASSDKVNGPPDNDLTASTDSSENCEMLCSLAVSAKHHRGPP